MASSAGHDRGAAFVVLAPGTPATETDLLDLVRHGHPVPDAITTVSIVDELPRNSAGKLHRAALRASSPEPRSG